MIPKITIVFNRRKTATATKVGSIDFSISFSGKRRFLSSGLSVTTKEWRNGLVVGRNATAFNRQINAIYEKLAADVAKMAKGGSIDIGLLQVCEKGEDGKILDYLPQYAKDKGIRPSTLRGLENSLRVFQRHGVVYLSQATKANIQKAIASIRSDYKPKSLSCTVTRFMGMLRYLKRKDVISNVPDVDFYKPHEAPGIKYLTEAQVREITELQLVGNRSKARDIFLFAVYTGLSVSDIVKIDKHSVTTERGKHYISSARQKTGIPYKVLLSDNAMELLRRYDYELGMNYNTLLWNLKAIGKEIGLPFQLSMHKGRHTFATIALNHGVPIEVVSKMLAHSEISTTQIYAKVLQQSVDDGYSKIEHIF